MKTLSILFLLSVSLCNCQTKKGSDTNDIEMIRTIGITDSLPVLTNTVQKNADDSVRYVNMGMEPVSFYKDYRLYHLRRFGGGPKDWSHSFSQNWRQTDSSYYYFARRGRDSIVFRIDSLTDPVFKKLPVDSLYRWSSTYKEPMNDWNKLLADMRKTAVYGQGGLLIEKYVLNERHNEESFDTVYLEFSKNALWDSIPYSFSFSADSATMKLVKYRLIYNGAIDVKSKYYKRRFKVTTELKEEHPKNEEELLGTFLRFEKFLNH